MSLRSERSPGAGGSALAQDLVEGVGGHHALQPALDLLGAGCAYGSDNGPGELAEAQAELPEKHLAAPLALAFAHALDAPGALALDLKSASWGVRDMGAL